MAKDLIWIFLKTELWILHIDDCSNSSVLAMALLQSCTNI